jgi:hypothetical protein
MTRFTGNPMSLRFRLSSLVCVVWLLSLAGTTADLIRIALCSGLVGGDADLSLAVRRDDNGAI